jgi:hypothetical protein
MRNPSVHWYFPNEAIQLGIFQWTGPGRVEADGHEGMIRH